jgi:hypothetical protein
MQTYLWREIVIEVGHMENLEGDERITLKTIFGK